MTVSVMVENTVAAVDMVVESVAVVDAVVVVGTVAVVETVAVVDIVDVTDTRADLELVYVLRRLR